MTISHSIFPPMSGADIDGVAYDLIRRYQPWVMEGELPFRIERFAEIDLEKLTGVDVDYSPELPDGIHGLTDSGNNRLLIRADIVDNPYGQKYLHSTLAHEVGHVMLHVPMLREACRNRIFRQRKDEEGGMLLYRREPAVPAYLDPEWQAWRFTAALLMPEAPLRALQDEGLPLGVLADGFAVNTVFLKRRLRWLKTPNSRVSGSSEIPT
jgi:hypothetical protein